MERRLEFWVPAIGEDEKTLVSEVLASGFLNDGAVTTQFENEVAEVLRCKHVVATTSGTSALFLALAAAGVGHADEVIVPDITFIATANAVRLTGARPVLVDVDPSRLTLDPAATEKAITSRTKAIVPVHLSGRAADIKSILEIAHRHGLAVIEDAAEAFVSKHGGKYLGTFGLAGCFSLSPNKTITSGQGGLVVTDDERLHVCLRELKDQGRPVRGTGGDDIHNAIGFNFKFTNLQAAVALAQLRDLRRRVERMQAIYRGYVSGLQELKGIALLPFCVEAGEVPQWTDAIISRRDELFDYLSANGMHGRRFWHPLHRQPPYRLPDERFPNSTKLGPLAMWLPSAFTLSDDDIHMICTAIRQYLCS